MEESLPPSKPDVFVRAQLQRTPWWMMSVTLHAGLFIVIVLCSTVIAVKPHWNRWADVDQYTDAPPTFDEEHDPDVLLERESELPDADEFDLPDALAPAETEAETTKPEVAPAEAFIGTLGGASRFDGVNTLASSAVNARWETGSHAPPRSRRVAAQHYV